MLSPSYDSKEFSKRPTILIIDDDFRNISILSNLLQEENYEVLVAEDGESGVSRAIYAMPDIILLDVVMTGIDGFETCRQLKSLPAVQDIPIIFITGTSGTEEKVRGFNLGAVDFISKPYQFQEVLSRTKTHLRMSEMSRRLQKVNESMEAVFSCMRDGVITIDTTGMIINSNFAARNLCDILDGQNDQSMESITARCSGKCRQIITESQLKMAPVRSIRQECNSKARPRQVVSLTASPLYNAQGKNDGTVLVIRDETMGNESNSKRNRFSDYMIGRSKNMQDVFAMIEELSTVSTTAIIYGESGCGKELVASALHNSGNRRNAPFVKVNCAAIQDSLLESELFGHVKGSFTGAHSDRAGRFEMAEGGTIFLDEIGDISPQMQTRLLRVLQEKEFEKVGDSVPIKVNVRIVAATNQNLAQKVKNGTFREDLFYRLNVFAINLPPLRDRKEDIPALVEHFIKSLGPDINKEAVHVSADVMDRFTDFVWPGNVRELRNTIEYALVRCKGSVILLEHLPPEFLISYANTTSEKDAISAALAAAGGNKALAARNLNMDRKTLYRKLERLEIDS